MTHRIFNSKAFEYIFSYVCALIPRIIIVLAFALPMNNSGDEIFLFALPAKLAGLDWQSSMQSYRYYGYGNSILFTPLFFFMDNPILLYKTVLLIVSAVQSLIAPVSCFILKRFFKIENRIWNITASVTMAYCVCLTMTYMYSEHIYTFIVWLCALCLLFLHEHVGDAHKKAVYTVLLSAVLLLALSIHVRAVTLVIAAVFLYLLYFLLYRKRLFYFSLMLPVYGAGYFANKYVVRSIVSYIMGAGLTDAAGSGVPVQNVSVSFHIPFEVLTDFNMQKAWLSIVIGQLNIWNIFTGGMAVFSIVIGLYLMAAVIKRRISGEDTGSLVLILGIFAVSCIGITVLGQSFSWLGGVARAIEESDKTADSLRALTYIRYLIPYFPPALLGILAYLYYRRDIFVRLFRYTLLTTVLLETVWMKGVLPYIQNTLPCSGFYRMFSTFDADIRRVYASTYIPALVFIVIFLFIIYAACKAHANYHYLSFICIFTLYVYAYRACLNDSIGNERNYSFVEEAYRCVKAMEIEKDKEWVYVRQASMPSGQGFLYELQFLLKDIPLQKGRPAQGLSEVIYITTAPDKDEDLLEEGYGLYRFNENVYAYVKGQEMEKKLGRTGLSEETEE